MLPQNKLKKDPQGKINWEHVGSLGHVEEPLKEIDDFLSWNPGILFTFYTRKLVFRLCRYVFGILAGCGVRKSIG